MVGRRWSCDLGNKDNERIIYLREHMARKEEILDSLDNRSSHYRPVLFVGSPSGPGALRLLIPNRASLIS